MAKGRKNPRTVAEGRELAVEMLRHLEQYALNKRECFQWSIQAMYRDEQTPQDNVVLTYLKRCREPGALAGFCSIVTDYLGTCVGEGGIPDIDASYGRLTERQITGERGRWPDPNEEFEKEQAALRSFMDGLTGERRV